MMKHLLYFVLVSMGIVCARPCWADILLVLENPTHNQRVSGISTISGWAFSSVPNTRVTVHLRIDGVDAGTIPCCGDRADVAQQFPMSPQARQSGFGALLNFNLLADGPHTLTVEVQDNAGSTPAIQEHLITVVRPGGYEFLSHLDLTTADDDNVSFDSERKEIIVQGVQATDEETAQKQKVNIHLAWQETAQRLAIVSTENIGGPDGGDSGDDGDDDEDTDNPCDDEDDDNDDSCNEDPSAIHLLLENPPELGTLPMSGIGIVSGWVFTLTPGATMRDVRLRIDGKLAADIPCCSERKDVLAAFPDWPQSIQSGVGALVNFNLFESGAHTMTIETEDSAGVTYQIERSVNTVRVADSEFLDQFDLSEATASIDEGTLFLEDVWVRDKASQQHTQVSVGYVWEQSCQCLVAASGCGNGTIESGEECDGAALDGETCASLGFQGGTLTCRPRCDEDDDDCELPCAFAVESCTGGPSVYVTNATSNTVSVISTVTNEVVATVKVGKEPRGIALSPDGVTAYVSNLRDNTLSVLDTASHAVTATLAVGEGPLGVAVAPDGTRVYVVNGFSDSVSVVDTATRAVEATIPVGREPQAIALTADGTQAYVTNFADDSVTVLDLRIRTPIRTITVGKGPNGITVSPDNTRVYVVNYSANTVSVLARMTNLVEKTVQVGLMPTKVVFAPDGAEAFVTNSMSQSVSVIDTVDLTVERTIPVSAGDSPITRPDGFVVATGGTRLYVAEFGNGFGTILQVISPLTNGTLKYVEVGEGPFAVTISPPAIPPS